MIVTGAAWVFGDNVNTDLMYPSASFAATDEERKRLVFDANRPGWSAKVRPGELLVAGTSFGAGSGRPAPKYLRMLGITGILAESVNGLFLRNSINFALPIIECPGITAATTEGDVLTVDYGSGAVTNTTTGAALQGRGLPDVLLDLIRSGGLLEVLIERGLVEMPSQD
jgi:3-isopropylmalate/(R)-2-methylmalate dehydratase small subunit